jgi:gamma-glutamylputrescine oxidase
VVVLEAQQVGYGASGRNGGQAIHGLACDMATIEAQLGQADAGRVWGMTIEALHLLQERIKQHHIACDWQCGYLGLATSPRKARALVQWAQHTQQAYGYALQTIAANDLPQWIASPRYSGGVYDPQSGHLHPLKYTLGLARAAVAAGVRVHENTAALELIHGPKPALRTAQGTVHARQVLLAGNVYLQGLAPALAKRVMPVGTYIATTEPLGEARALALVPSRSAVCDTNFVLDYFRTTADHRLLYGGLVSYSTRTPSHLAARMQRRMVHTFAQLQGVQVQHAWGGFVDITMNRAPDFGRLPACQPGTPANVYYLQGFSGHGLALTGLAGRLVAEAIHGDSSRFDVFARLQHRPFVGGARLRTPALVLGMAWYRLRDMLG